MWSEIGSRRGGFLMEYIVRTHPTRGKRIHVTNDICRRRRRGIVLLKIFLRILDGNLHNIINYVDLGVYRRPDISLLSLIGTMAGVMAGKRNKPDCEIEPIQTQLARERRYLPVGLPCPSSQ
jgi:hypothetical protein